jgi:hypothetical protein
MLWDKHPWWIPTTGSDTSMIHPNLYNERLGRGGTEGTTDAFGIKWEYIPAAGGSIVRPGEPFVADANELKDKIKFPDIDAWDWESAFDATHIDARLSTNISFVNGFWFERLISFMDFAPAAMALLDEDQEDALLAFFGESTDFACKLVDKVLETWPNLDGIEIHDDWGAQRSPFFSNEIAYKFFVPFMKQLGDHIHKSGRYYALHSCGHIEDRVQCFIDGGFDIWTPQTMNDTYRLFDEFGDKICISVVPKPDESAEDFAKHFCVPGKMVQIAHYGAANLTPEWMDELYECSRKMYFA